MATATRVDHRQVSLTQRQWRLILSAWSDAEDTDPEIAAVMVKAVPLIAARCREVESPDDIVTVTASVPGWQQVAAFCQSVEVLRWAVGVDLQMSVGA